MQLISHGSSRRSGRGRFRSSSAFSLVELLVVLAVMLIVLFMSKDAYFAARDKGRLKACASNLAGQYVALQTWANDHDGRFPVATNAITSDEPLSLLIPRYTTQTEFWICPGSGDSDLKPAISFEGRRISYGYYMGRQLSDSPQAVLVTDEQVDVSPKIEHQLIFSADGEPPANNHEELGGNYLLVNGTVGNSPVHAAIAFPIATNITYLNPKP